MRGSVQTKTTFDYVFCVSCVYIHFTLKLRYLSKTYVTLCTLNKNMKSRTSFPPVSIWVNMSQRFLHIWVQKYTKNTFSLKMSLLIIQLGRHRFQLRKHFSGDNSINAQRIALTRGPWWPYIAHLSKEICILTQIHCFKFLYKFSDQEKHDGPIFLIY